MKVSVLGLAADCVLWGIRGSANKIALILSRRQIVVAFSPTDPDQVLVFVK